VPQFTEIAALFQKHRLHQQFPLGNDIVSLDIICALFDAVLLTNC
jgi:hypothetical protein